MTQHMLCSSHYASKSHFMFGCKCVVIPYEALQLYTFFHR